MVIKQTDDEVTEQQALQQRIIKHIAVTPTGCWLWTGVLISNRYPGMRVQRKLVSVRRLVYGLWGLKPLLRDGVVRSVCLNDVCVNPTHLVRSQRLRGGTKATTKRSTKSQRYPWEQWFTRPVILLRRGKDFTCAPHSMAMQVRQWARHHGLPISLSIHNDVLTITQKGKPRATTKRRK